MRRQQFKAESRRCTCVKMLWEAERVFTSPLAPRQFLEVR